MNLDFLKILNIHSHLKVLGTYLFLLDYEGNEGLKQEMEDLHYVCFTFLKPL